MDRGPKKKRTEDRGPKTEDQKHQKQQSWKKFSISELEEAVRKHNRLYFVKHLPEISDAEFDRLVEILKKQKPDSPVLAEIGSDVGVVGPEGGDKTVRHAIPMLSLDKCYSEKDLHHWASKFECKVLAMPKIDGCAVALRYDARGHLVLALTRGSGLEGEVITHNVKHVKGIPQKISLKNVEVRGEIYMPLSVFKKFRETFANPRNLAAGAIKQKDPKKTADYDLRFFGYDLFGPRCKTEEEKRRFLKKEGFGLAEGRIVQKNEMQKIFDGYYRERNQRDYETDGVVYKANDTAVQEELGVTAHHPRFAIAYKFQGDAGQTRLHDVIWSVSRTGTITPVAFVDPVKLSGATITRVTLHNYGLAKKMGITIPAKVLVVRRGGVIPNIEEVIEGKGKPLKAPKKCPSCGSPVELHDDFLYCTNPKKCAVTMIAELNHFVKVAGIDGFGPKHLKQLYEKGIVKDPGDFYKLAVKDLIPLERMGETLAAKLIANIEARKKLPLDVFLRALGIAELGKHVSKILARFGNLDKIFKLTPEELTQIHTIGERIAMRVVDGLKEKRALIDALLKQVTLEAPAVGVGPLRGGPLSGKSFLFTGILLAMERHKAEELVESKGGVAAIGVSKNLDYLVVGDGGGAGSKLDKVKALQQKGATTQILSEKEFLKRIHR